MWTVKRVWWRVALCTAALACTAGTTRAAETKNPAKAAYMKYCSACHGAEGKGDGVAATFLRPKPIDLTQIAKTNGGKFPFIKVLQAIDGTNTIGAHGDRDMPVWGEVFKEQGAPPLAEKAAVRGKAQLITEYVRGIQEK